MSEHKEPIPSMIYNAAVGGHVTNSQQIIDENENKEQSQINAEVKQNLGQGGSVDTRISQAKNDIIGGASSNANTLKKIEDRVLPLESAVGTGGSVDSRISAAVATETTRAQAAEEQLRQAYEVLSQSQPIPVTSLPATGEAGKIYRLAGETSYADYMYAEGDLTTPIKMAEYDNAIDDEPTPDSDNLVKSGGVNFLKDGLNFTKGYKLDATGSLVADINIALSPVIIWDGQSDVTISFSNSTAIDCGKIIVYNESMNVADYFSTINYTERTFTVSELRSLNVASFRFGFQISNGAYTWIKFGNNIVWNPKQNDKNIELICSDPDRIKERLDNITYNYVKGYNLDSNGNAIVNASCGHTFYISYVEGNDIEWKHSDINVGCLIAYNEDKFLIDYWGSDTSSGKITIPSSSLLNRNIKYIRASFALGTNANIKIGNEIVWEEKEGLTSSNTTANNRFKSSAIEAIGMKIGFELPLLQNKYLVLVHGTDFHGDAARFKRMIDFAENYKHIVSGVIVTGDLCANDWRDSGFEDTYVANYQNTSLPVLPVIGNHDVALTQVDYTPTNSNENVGARFITPYMQRCGGIQGNTNAGYYFKDFTTQKIRVIVINEYEIPRTLNDEGTAFKYPLNARWITQEQANWLISTLNSVPADYGVVIATHQLIDAIDIYDNEFKCSIGYGSGDSYIGQRAFVDGTSVYMIQYIVDAYISRSVISDKEFSSVITEGMPVVTISADFTNANGEFICYLNGHTHKDNIGESSTTVNKQININCTNGSIQDGDHYDDLYRKEGAVSEDCFNIIAFDTERKEIRVLRIGANVSADMRRRDYACISYAQSFGE